MQRGPTPRLGRYRLVGKGEACVIAWRVTCIQSLTKCVSYSVYFVKELHDHLADCSMLGMYNLGKTDLYIVEQLDI